MKQIYNFLHVKFSSTQNSSGFTLLELIIFVAISTTATVAFMAMLVSVTRVQVRQTAASEVNLQSQFLLQTIQRNVESASIIDATTTDATSSAITLRMSSSSQDKIEIYRASSSATVGTVYIRQTNTAGNATTSALTSDKVNVSSLSFAKRLNPPGHDSVSVMFTMEYATQSPTQRFAQILQTSVARVSAATFDSNLLPSTGGLDIGTSAGSRWNSLNQVIYFNGNNVGISGTGSSFAPRSALEVQGGDIYVDQSAYGIMLVKPNGGCARVSVSNVSAITVTSTTCP